MRRPLRRKAIALIAAYALALQGLWSAFVPVAVALPAAVLCSGQMADDPGAPAGHELACTSACVMLGASAAPPPATVIARTFERRRHELMPIAPPRAAAPRGLQTARAPPSFE
jgi:hypothetical protein